MKRSNKTSIQMKRNRIAASVIAMAAVPAATYSVYADAQDLDYSDMVGIIDLDDSADDLIVELSEVYSHIDDDLVLPLTFDVDEVATENLEGETNLIKDLAALGSLNDGEPIIELPVEGVDDLVGELADLDTEGGLDELVDLIDGDDLDTDLIDELSDDFVDSDLELDNGDLDSIDEITDDIDTDLVDDVDATLG